MGEHHVRVPRLGSADDEGEVVQVHVQIGDIVGADSPIADIETAKVTLTVTSEVAGTVVHLGVEEGTILSAGELICTVNAG